MTGIERLRDFARHMKDFSVWPGGQKLLDIADQIEREADVETVRSDVMKAWEWVRAHGGLDHVKDEWCSRVPFDVHEKRRRRLLNHIAECEAALGRRNVRIDELGHRVNDLMLENAELRRRAMPEGCEWPRYEDGEPVRFEDELPEFSETIYKTVKTVLFQNNGCIVIENNGGSANRRLILWKNERVRRPAVLAADGEPLEVGQTVWHEDGTELRVAGFKHWEDGEAIVAVNYVDGPTIWSEVRSLSLTHTKPEPSDSWERIEEDIGKNFSDYWGCKSSSCANCSATVDGKTPYRRFGVDNCIIARNVDLVRRCRALAERERGE